MKARVKIILASFMSAVILALTPMAAFAGGNNNGRYWSSDTGSGVNFLTERQNNGTGNWWNDNNSDPFWSNNNGWADWADTDQNDNMFGNFFGNTGNYLLNLLRQLYYALRNLFGGNSWWNNQSVL